MRQSSSQKRRSSKATQSTKYEGFQVFKPLEACICHWWPSAAVPCTEVETIRPLVGFVTSGGFSSHHGGLAMTCSKHANRQPKKQIDRQHLAHTNSGTVLGQGVVLELVPSCLRVWEKLPEIRQAQTSTARQR